MTLTEFLQARIAEDEAKARAAYSEGPWRSGTTHTAFVSVEAMSWTVVSDLDRADADHIATWDPARVLAECEAKRRIVEHCEPDLLALSPGDDYVLRLLALPYADREGFREEWRP